MAQLPPLTYDAGSGSSVQGSEDRAHVELVGRSAAHTLLETGVVAVERVLAGTKLTDLSVKCHGIFDEIDEHLKKNGLNFRTQDESFSFAEVASRDRGRLDVNLDTLGKSSIVAMIKEHPVVQAFLQHLHFSREPLFSGVVFSLPGSVSQAWHRDGNHLFPDYVSLPPHAVTIFVPLVDITSPGLGATQFCPGTHLMSDEQCNSSEHHVFSFNPMKAGSLIMLDYRVLHRGVANTSKELRPLLYMVFAKPWFKDAKNFKAERCT